jgi:hypothetical protein
MVPLQRGWLREEILQYERHGVQYVLCDYVALWLEYVRMDRGDCDDWHYPSVRSC